MNKLIFLGLLALLISSIYAYDFPLCPEYEEAVVDLKDIVGDDFEEVCPALKTEGDYTHCCYVKESSNSTISAKCVQITDDQYENIKNFKNYIKDENDDEDFKIDCSSNFVAISLFAVLVLLF